MSFLNQDIIEFLCRKADENPRRRCRLCLHDNADAPLHEMLIVHKKGNYIPPHKHLHSDESCYIVDGEGAMILFDDNGEVINCQFLNNDAKSGRNFQRTPVNTLHSLYVESEYFIFKETVLGPFDSKNYFEPGWAPSDETQTKAFMAQSKHLFESSRNRI